MTREEVKSFLYNRKGYIKEGGKRLRGHLANKGFQVTTQTCKDALREVREELRKDVYLENFNTKVYNEPKTHKDIFRNVFNEKEIINVFKKSLKVEQNKGKNVLVIGDLHEPFCLEGYLEHCLETYNKYNCNEVVFIGDIIDNHATSYHETDPDGHNAGQELKLAVNNIQKWHQAFPKATVIIGNHDRLIMRKAYTAGVSKMWIKDYADVLGTSGWNFTESIEIDDVLYIHGEGGTARNRARRDLQSVVQGHLHTQMYIDWIVGKKFKIFAVQVGCGVNHQTYAMTYAKEFAKPAIGCAVILKGKQPISIPMDL